MNNFEFYTPDADDFRGDPLFRCGKIVKEYGFKRCWFIFGGASARKTGLLDTVCSALEAGGNRLCAAGRRTGFNPTLSIGERGIELCLAEKVDFCIGRGRRQRDRLGQISSRTAQKSRR